MISQKELDKLFAWAKTDQGWPLIRNFMKKNPFIVRSVGGKWKETLMHWAALGEMAAIVDLLDLGADVNAIDNQSKTPLNWALEKLYFMREPVNGKSPSNAWLIGEKNAEDAAIKIIHAGGVLGPQCNYTVMQLALSSGSVSAAALWMSQNEFNKNDLDFGLSGFWRNEKDFMQFLEMLEQWVPEKNWGLEAVHYVNQEKMTLDVLEWIHKAGFRVDVETRHESMESICAQYKNGAYWQQKIEEKLKL